MAHEKTLDGNTPVRLDQLYNLFAGIDEEDVPQIARVVGGRLQTSATGVSLPLYDNLAIAYYGSTNNIETIIYTLATVEVARWTFTYIGGGAADNDKLLSGAFTLAP